MVTYTYDDRIVDQEKAKGSIREPKTVLVQEFTEESSKQFDKDIGEAVQTGQEIVPIIIDSYGGQVYSLLSMIDTMEAYQSEVKFATICKGKAMSCGSVLLACGNMRYIGHRATVMIHEVSSVELGKLKEIKAGVAEAERLNKKIMSILDIRSNKTPGYYETLIDKAGHADIFLTPQQAVEHGLVDKIKIPYHNVSISVKTEFYG